MYLVDSVFPAPDSPDTMIDWLTRCVFMSLYDLSAESTRFVCIGEKVKMGFLEHVPLN